MTKVQKAHLYLLESLIAIMQLNSLIAIMQLNLQNRAVFHTHLVDVVNQL